ncbi:MAG TPA: hypothetical protein VGM20_04345 [Gemmatimonadales bacterium]
MDAKPGEERRTLGEVGLGAPAFRRQVPDRVADLAELGNRLRSRRHHSLQRVVDVGRHPGRIGRDAEQRDRETRERNRWLGHDEADGLIDLAFDVLKPAFQLGGVGAKTHEDVIDLVAHAAPPSASARAAWSR